MVLYYFRRDKYNDVQTEGRFASLNITTGDEIENLANSMTEMDKDIAEYEDNLTMMCIEFRGQAQ